MKVKDLSTYKYEVKPEDEVSKKQFNYWMLSPLDTEGQLEVLASMGYQMYAADKNSAFYFVRGEGKKVRFHVCYDKNMSVAVLHENYAADWDMMTAKGGASLWMNLCEESDDPQFSENSSSRKKYLRNSLIFDLAYILFCAALVAVTFVLTMNIGMNVVYRICQGVILGALFVFFSWSGFYRIGKVLRTFGKMKGRKKK